MKKYLFFAAAVAITACTNDTLIDDTKVPDTKEVAIGFGSDINKLVMTRAENSTATDTKGLENYHYTFRIWGYKNIKNASTSAASEAYTSTAVFDGKADGSKYENSIATWSPVANNTDPFNHDETLFDGGDWVYSPVRYWDKTAYNYDFHAAAPDKDSTIATPAALDWQWKQINIDGTTGNPTDPAFTSTTADAKGAGYFTLGTEAKPFKLNGESLPLANATVTTAGTGGSTTYKNVTTQPDDVFGGKKGTAPSEGWTVKDNDLMIAEDVLETPTNHSSVANGNARVNFHFNHILSRLNIGVKIGDQIAVKQMVTNTEDSKKYLLYTATDGKTYIKLADGKAQEVTLSTDGKSVTKTSTSPATWADVPGIKINDNVENPTEGVVLLKDIEVVNLVTDGCFDEGVLAWSDAATQAMNGNDGTTNEKPKVTPTDLKNKGTNLRWALGTTKTTETTSSAANKYAFPNEKVTGLEDGDETGTEKSGPLNLSKKFTLDSKDYTKNDYKMVFQGLVIPQVAEYESVPVDGSTKGTKPYIKIVYELDGEEFTNYYNLAEVFSNVLGAYTTTDGCNIIKNGTDSYVLVQVTPASTTGGTPTIKYYQVSGTYPAFTKGTEITDVYFVNATDNKWWNTSWEEQTTKPSGTPILVNASNGLDYVLRKEVSKECDITFCEGWQNNLWITINPTAILFDADVYKWATKYKYEFTVE